MQATKWIAAGLLALVGCTAAARSSGGALTTRTPLVGSWHLVSLDLPGANGALRHITDAKGSLIYTSSGRVSVQVMYARADSTPSSGPVQYALGGCAPLNMYVSKPMRQPQPAKQPGPLRNSGSG